MKIEDGKENIPFVPRKGQEEGSAGNERVEIPEDETLSQNIITAKQGDSQTPPANPPKTVSIEKENGKKLCRFFNSFVELGGGVGDALV